MIVLLKFFSDSGLVAGSTFYIPRSLIALMILISLGMIVSMYGTIRNKVRYGKYQKLAPAQDGTAQKTPTSYQNSAEYALPPKQKVVTYCVIDGRLVDQ
jgi:hypothetical protein